MVALGILVPSVSVRIAAVQQRKRPFGALSLLNRVFDPLGRELPKPLRSLRSITAPTERALSLLNRVFDPLGRELPKPHRSRRSVTAPTERALFLLNHVFDSLGRPRGRNMLLGDAFPLSNVAGGSAKCCRLDGKAHQVQSRYVAGLQKIGHLQRCTPRVADLRDRSGQKWRPATQRTRTWDGNRPDLPRNGLRPAPGQQRHRSLSACRGRSSA